MKSFFLGSILLLFGVPIGLQAQVGPTTSGGLSGSVSMGAPSSSGGADQIKEVVATGIGADAASAEKQALSAAVQQAVGSYLDTKTVTENEEVIKDRVLSLSNGFVSKYEVISGPKQRDDKLFEVTVKAQVQGGQVMAKLKEVNLIKGEVAGHNLYAQNLTQMLSAEDAIKMLNEKLPELFVNCIKMEFVDKEGNPQPNSNPVEQLRDDQTHKVKCTWYLKLSVDKKVYIEQMFPLVKKCFEVMLAVKPEKLNGTRQILNWNNSNEKQKEYNENNRLSWKTNFGDKATDYAVVLIESLSRNYDSIEGLHYSGSKYKLERSRFHPYDDNSGFGKCCFTLKSSSGELISKTIISMGGHDFNHQHDWDNLNPFANDMEGWLPIFSPFLSASRLFDNITAVISVVEPVKVEIAMNDFKDISKVDVQILPPTYDFILKVNPNIR